MAEGGMKHAADETESEWRAKHDDLEEELQQASLVIVELEDELEQTNRRLADHERQIAKMVQELPPTPAGLKQAQRIGADGDDGDDTGASSFAPGLPTGQLGGLLSAADGGDGGGQQQHHHLRRENERLKSEVRNLLEQSQLVADSDAGSVSSDGSFGTAAVPTVGAGGAGHMRAQLEHYKSEVIRLEQKVRALRNESAYRDKVIAALRDSEPGGGGGDNAAGGGGGSDAGASTAELDALRDFASQSTALAEQRGAKASELEQALTAAREQQRALESEASAAVRHHHRRRCHHRRTRQIIAPLRLPLDCPLSLIWYSLTHTAAQIDVAGWNRPL
jgi:hypothetical protein